MNTKIIASGLIAILLLLLSGIIVIASANTDIFYPYMEVSPGASVWCVDFSPDSTKLALSITSYVKIWDISNDRCIKTIRSDYPTVWRVSWSPDGTKIAFSFYNEKQGTDMIDIYDTHSWNRIVRIIPPSGGTAATSIAWSPDSTKIAFETYDGTYTSHGIKIWDISNKKLIKTISTPYFQQSDVVWSPDGTKIVSYSHEVGCLKGTCTKSIRAYDSMTGDIIWEYPNYNSPSGGSNHISWSADGKKLALAGSDGITILDAGNGLLLKKFGSYTYSIDWSPNGTKVVAGCSRRIMIFDVYSGETIWASPSAFTNSVDSVSWSSDGTKIASCSVNDKSNLIKIYVEQVTPTPPPVVRPTPRPTLTPIPRVVATPPPVTPTPTPAAVLPVSPTPRPTLTPIPRVVATPPPVTPTPTPAAVLPISPKYLYAIPIALFLILLPFIFHIRGKKKKGAKTSEKPSPPSLEQKEIETQKVKEERISPPISKSITIERAIYDPCKRDFVERRLPRMKEWINRYDPGAYWFVISIQNNTDRAIEEWGVELETSSALKVEEVKIEGIDYKIELRETYPEPYKNVYAIGVPKEYGIVIPKGGAQRVYFKLRADKPKTVYEISGVFKSAIGEVPIRAKEFKYLCDAGVSPEAVKAELKKTFPEKDAARLALSFKIVQEIDRMCNTGAKTEEYIDKLLSLKNYTEGFSDKFTTQVDEFARFMKQEQLEYLDEEYKVRVRRFCTNLVDVWISEFLKG